MWRWFRGFRVSADRRGVAWLPRLVRWRRAAAALPWAELAAASALVVGWLLVTWAVASLLGVWQVYPLSAGLFALSMFGWRYLYVMAREGLYTLTRGSGR